MLCTLFYELAATLTLKMPHDCVYNKSYLLEACQRDYTQKQLKNLRPS